MQYLILSDLHANWRALEAVLQDVEGEYDRIVCCGDLVGYNPHPARVIDWVADAGPYVIRGNHDKVVAGIDDIDWFNDVAQIAARWTQTQLDDGKLEWLRALRKGPLQLDELSICHGSLSDEDQYVSSIDEAEPQFPAIPGQICFFGHTHLQGGFFSKYGRVAAIRKVPSKLREVVLELEPDVTYLINPGAVGQPRDRDPRAAYALYNSDSRLICLRRVDYDIAGTLADIRAAGLPDVLGLRLIAGY